MCIQDTLSSGFQDRTLCDAWTRAWKRGSACANAPAHTIPTHLHTRDNRVTTVQRAGQGQGKAEQQQHHSGAISRLVRQLHAGRQQGILV
jgi:hypothetical protein